MITSCLEWIYSEFLKKCKYIIHFPNVSHFLPQVPLIILAAFRQAQILIEWNIYNVKPLYKKYMLT